jgi:hypothetical protein
MMIAAARAELIGAHLEQWGLGPLAHHVTPLLDTRGRDARAHVRSLALNSMRRTAIGRRILLVVAGVAVVSLAVFGVAAALFAHALI